MEGEYIPTIIQLILSTDLALIQLKDSLKFFLFPTYPSLVTNTSDDNWLDIIIYGTAMKYDLSIMS